jgi:hypothetical protein
LLSSSLETNNNQGKNMAKKVNNIRKTKNDDPAKKARAKERATNTEKQVLTRIIEQTNDAKERIYRIEFQIPHAKSEWMWLGTMPTRQKAKRIAQMCREGNL